jgi:hypothetical protein
VKDLICAELSGVEIIRPNVKDILHLCKQKDTLSDVSEAEDVKWVLCLHLQVLTQVGIRPFCFVRNS